MEKAKERNNSRKKLKLILLFLLILVPAVWFLFINKGNKSEMAADKLAGDWLRSDGTYSISVSHVKEDGQLTATYFNPNPIHVEKAEWNLSNGRLFVIVELNDVNYRGSNYKLFLDEKSDRLYGTYFLAGTGETFEVMFSRK